MASAVITGIGVVLPETNTLDELWQYQHSNRDTLVAPLSATLRGTTIDESTLEGSLPSRTWKKLDSFTRYALIATERAIRDASLNLAILDKERCGVFVGNTFGGWKFTEEQLRILHCKGPRMVSPYQATSWFPAAPQGQITIQYEIKGCSKTYMADRSSSLISVASATDMIRQGKLDVAIAGGTESTNTDFVKAALTSLATREEAIATPWPTPLSPQQYGFLVSEGAVFLILENRDIAIARNARIYAEVAGFATRNAPCAPGRYSTKSKAMVRAIEAALGGSRPDVILPDACGLAGVDDAEVAAIQEVCPQTVAAPIKMKYGHTFGAEGALDIAYACLMFQRRELLPPFPGSSTHRTDTAGSVGGEGLNRVLINGRSLGGGASSLSLCRGDH